LESLTTILDFHASIARLAQHTSDGELPLAVSALLEVKETMRGPTAIWIKETEAWRALTKWVGEEEITLEEALTEALRTCFVFEAINYGPAKLTIRSGVHGGLHGDLLSITSILDSLDLLLRSKATLGGLDSHLGRIASQLYQNVILPLLQHNGALESAPRVVLSFIEGPNEATITLSPSTVATTNSVISDLQQVLSFFESHSTLLHHPVYSPIFTLHLTPPLQSAVISHQLRLSLPRSIDGLGTYLPLLASAASLEESFLKEAGYFSFLPSNLERSEESQVIRAWISRVDVYWARSIGDQVLERVRGEICKGDWESDVVEILVEDEELEEPEPVTIPPAPPVQRMVTPPPPEVAPTRYRTPSPSISVQVQSSPISFTSIRKSAVSSTATAPISIDSSLFPDLSPELGSQDLPAFESNVQFETKKDETIAPEVEAAIEIDAEYIPFDNYVPFTEIVQPEYTVKLEAEIEELVQLEAAIQGDQGVTLVAEIIEEDAAEPYHTHSESRYELNEQEERKVEALLEEPVDDAKVENRYEAREEESAQEQEEQYDDDAGEEEDPWGFSSSPPQSPQTSMVFSPLSPMPPPTSAAGVYPDGSTLESETSPAPAPAPIQLVHAPIIPLSRPYPSISSPTIPPPAPTRVSPHFSSATSPILVPAPAVFTPIISPPRPSPTISSPTIPPPPPSRTPLTPVSPAASIAVPAAIIRSPTVSPLRPTPPILFPTIAPPPPSHRVLHPSPEPLMTTSPRSGPAPFSPPPLLLSTKPHVLQSLPPPIRERVDSVVSLEGVEDAWGFGDEEEEEEGQPQVAAELEVSTTSEETAQGFGDEEPIEEVSSDQVSSEELELMEDGIGAGADDGWGFVDEVQDDVEYLSTISPEQIKQHEVSEIIDMEEAGGDDAWGFDDEVETETAAEYASPTKILPSPPIQRILSPPHDVRRATPPLVSQYSASLEVNLDEEDVSGWGAELDEDLDYPTSPNVPTYASNIPQYHDFSQDESTSTGLRVRARRSEQRLISVRSKRIVGIAEQLLAQAHQISDPRYVSIF
jgi:hypothetical protein